MVLAVMLVAVLAGGGLVVVQNSIQSTAQEGQGGGAPGGTAAQPAPSTTPPPRTPQEIAARIAVIEDQVAQARGLEFRREVPAEIQPSKELAAALLEQVDKETDEAELDRYGRALELLGQLPAGTDLPQLMRDLQAEGVLGYYLPGTGEGEGRLYVRADGGLTAFVEWVLAHELTHGVTDQHFDLTYTEKLSEQPGREDEVLAYNALAEGDATLAAAQYLQTQMPTEAQAAVAQEGLSQTTPQADQAPSVIQQSLIFPYQAGFAFVQALYQHGGWEAVNQAYTDPPTSTEQILHPQEKYLGTRRDEPQQVATADVAGALGSGWKPGVTAGWGEADTRWLLAEELPNTAADGGADGWDGGQLRTYQRGEATALTLETVWDSPEEATEFCQTASRWAESRFGAGQPTDTGGRWSGDGGQRTAMVCEGNRALWLSAPDPPALERMHSALDAS